MNEQDDLDGREVDLAVLIRNICCHPQMYTGSSDPVIVAAFIEGFAYCREESDVEIRQFNRWLANRLDFPRNWAWWSGLKEKYPKAEDALKALPALFEEFRGLP
ncbi:MAG: hypothetical protein IPK58_24040 [Acidobacteria bacterium]|nr:hypothetical protein [Acidobacteriota bacterium]